MFTVLMVALGALFFAAFVKYTVLVHQGWAEEEGERLGFEAESRGIGTILRGTHDGVPLWLALSGRRVTEGEARLRPGLSDPSAEAFLAAKALFGSAHFKSNAVWADFPRSKPDEDPERYADALALVASFASRRTPEELYRIEQLGDEALAAQTEAAAVSGSESEAAAVFGSGSGSESESEA